MQAERNKRAVSGRPPRLLEVDFHRLRADIKQPPAAFGFDALKWSGRLLAEHLLANYGVVLGLRQCRRILHSSGLRTSGAVALTPSVPKHSVESKSQKTASPWPISDSANKQRALTRIKRLCSSGLPLYPLAQALFELLNDAIPHGANRVLLADDGRHPNRYVVSSSELAGWGPIHKHFYVDSPPQVSGTLPVRTILEGKTVWRHEEIALAHFYRSEDYNECMRHIGFHHALMINLRDHLGLSGNYPMWRTSEMKPFTVDDVRFAEAAAPYIAHALSVASRVASVPRARLRVRTARRFWPGGDRVGFRRTGERSGRRRAGHLPATGAVRRPSG